MRKSGYVYMMTNRFNSVIYTGVTSDLKKRIYEHKQKFVDGFTKRYHIDKLVYYECCDSIENAILREKQIKAGSRRNKIDLIQTKNNLFRDLYAEV